MSPPTEFSSNPESYEKIIQIAGGRGAPREYLDAGRGSDERSREVSANKIIFISL